ncbi:MAG: DUF1801 domain-containing protein [Nanoarchaeota archaeon]|nr:DUF1801 domain-containing protein [Nanoarchaeota archaeon]
MMASVDDYIRAQPKEALERLERLRQTIKKAAPDAEELMSYGMPAFKLGRILVYYSAWKTHAGLYFASATVLDVFRKELSSYETTKGTIRFPIDKPLPIGLITKIVKYRVKENLAVKNKESAG